MKFYNNPRHMMTIGLNQGADIAMPMVNTMYTV